MKPFKKTTKTFYELMMVILAGLSVMTLWQKTGYNSYIVWGIWGIFFIDFIYRLYKTESKWEFIKKNPFLLIAAIPLDAIFQFARIARILHLLRLKSITKYYTMPVIRFLKKQHLLFVTSLSFLLVFLLIIPLKLLEQQMESYSEAWGHALMSLAFFGRGGFHPETSGGQIIVVIFTLLGVIIHGLILSTTIDYFMNSPALQQLIRKVKKAFGAK